MPVRTTPATHRLCAALLAALAAPALPAMAQEAGSKDAKPTVKTLDQVTVTGSRIKRAEIEQALPITSFTKEQIDSLWPEYLRLVNPEEMWVQRSSKLNTLRNRILKEESAKFH